MALSRLSQTSESTSNDTSDSFDFFVSETTEEHSYTWKLLNTRITSFSVSGSAGDEPIQTEDYSLSYEESDWIY